VEKLGLSKPQAGSEIIQVEDKRKKKKTAKKRETVHVEES